MQKNNSKKVRFKGFEGISTPTIQSKEPGIYDINNFSISSDGSLTKRCGFQCLHEFSQDIRDIWSGVIDGVFKYVFIVGSSVFSIEDQNIHSPKKIATLSTNAGSAQIFYYENSLFILDSSGLYSLSDDGISPVIGYIPLYGKNWGTTHPGEINEPLNLLNRYARISYIAPANYTAMLPTKHPVKQIISVYRNGNLVPTSNYGYDDELRFISLPEIRENDIIQVTVLFDIDLSDKGLGECTHASAFGDANNSRLLMWSDQKNVMFPSRYVLWADYELSKAALPESSRIYFPENNSFFIGDGRYKPRAVTRHYDRLLIFTEGDAWMASSGDLGTSDMPVMSINSSIGCASTLGSVLSGNSPFTVGHHDIFEWTSDTDELNECNAVSISTPINDRLSDEFFKNATVFKDVYKNELWFHNKNVSSDVWIYNVPKRAWVRFSEIHADKFFDANGSVGFIRGGNMYIFFSSNYMDQREDLNLTEIHASITTGNLDFGSSDLKRLSSYMIDTDLNRGTIEVSFLSDNDKTITDTISASKPRILRQRRLHSERFSYLKSVTLTDRAYSRPLIRDLEIVAR